jgi:Dolichyl-phosphate-mannose-protein mannosyltransferase
MPASKAPWKQVPIRIRIIIIGLIIFLGLVYAYNVLLVLRLDMPLQPEGSSLGFMHSIEIGRLYAPDALMTPPLAFLMHTPLSYYIEYLFWKLDPGHYWPLRLMTVVATLGVCVTIFIYQCRRGISSLAALFSAAMFFTSSAIFHWLLQARSPDQFQLIFTLIAFMVLQEQERKHRWTSLGSLMFSIAFVLAVFSKQTDLLTIPLTVGIWRVYRREFHNLATDIVLSGLLGTAVFLGFECYSHFSFHQNVMLHGYLPTMPPIFNDVVISESGLTLLFGGLIVLCFKTTDQLARIYFFVGLGVGLFTTTKLGSSAAHFFDLWTATCLIAGDVLHNAVCNRTRLKAHQWGILVAIGVLVVYFAKANLTYVSRFGSEKNKEMYASAIKYLKQMPDPVLAPDPGMLIQSEHTVFWDEPFIGAYRFKGDTNFLGMLNSDYFKSCVVDAWSPTLFYYPEPMFSIIKSNFVEVNNNDRYIFLVNQKSIVLGDELIIVEADSEKHLPFRTLREKERNTNSGFAKPMIMNVDKLSMPNSSD